MSDIPSITLACSTGTAAICVGSDGTAGTGAVPKRERDPEAAGSGGRAGRRSGFVAGAGESVAGTVCIGARGRVAGPAAEIAAESAGADSAGGDGEGDASAARCCSGSSSCCAGESTGAGAGRLAAAKGTLIEADTAAAATTTAAWPSLSGFARLGLDPPSDLTGATVSSMVGLGMTMSGMVDEGTVEN